MTQSKAWNWPLAQSGSSARWLTPSVESYALAVRWQIQHKQDFLDLGCGLGRHTILFAHQGFSTHAFDLSEEAIAHTLAWAGKEQLTVYPKTGDMLSLPYSDASFDCILCRNVITHTDTAGLIQVLSEIHRILRPGGEIFLTLGSKSDWAYQQNWPQIDPHTRIYHAEGPEFGIPHFYADRECIREHFKAFDILTLSHVEDINPKTFDEPGSWHYHLLAKKPG